MRNFAQFYTTMIKKAIFLSLLLYIGVATAAAQSTTIRGRVIFANDSLAAIGAVVKLNAEDTAKINRKGRVVATDANGDFQIVTSEKKIALTISYLGYADKTIDVPTDKRTVNLGKIALKESAFDVESVKVIGQASMSKIEGDTIQYNAAAFKTNPDATAEDLLKKMPGVTTDENGAVQSQGQSISKVYVNGKEYFQDDPTLALKSLPVDAVESIQMYDDQSDDAKFSGFDDGQRVRAVNIVTKKSFMNSISGKAYAGYGTSGRYSVGGRVNMFSDKHTLTIIAQGNNVNNQGVSMSDISQGGGGRGGRGQWRGSSNDLAGFTTPAFGGVMENYMAALNYNGQLSDKVKLELSYSYAGRNADVWSSKEQEYLTTTRNFASIDSSLGFNNAHRFRARLEWNPTEYDRINFNPSLDYSNNFGGSGNISQTTIDNVLSNVSASQYSTMLERMSGSADLWWQHRFKKAGRTLSIGAVVSGRKDLGNRNQYSAYTSNVMQLDTINQLGNVSVAGYTFTGSATYGEPISKRSRLLANYSITYDRTISDKQGLNWDEAMMQYALLDTTTTVYVNRNYTTHLAGFGYNYVLEKTLNLTVNVNYQNSTLNNDQATLRTTQPIGNSYTFQAVLPSASLSYTPKKGQNLKFDYNANSIYPSVTQLGDVLNVDNPLQVSKGNPNLRQSYSHQGSLRYNYANTEKNLNFNLYASGTFTQDYIATDRRFLTADTIVNGTTIVKGAQYSEPVNLQGYSNAGLHANFGFGIKPIMSNFNISTFYRYTRTPSRNDGIDYISDAHRIGVGLALTSNISENIDFTVAYRPGLNFTKGGTGRFDRYFSHDVSVFANIIFAKYFFVNADLTWRNSFGTQETYSNHYALLNAAIGAKFLRNRQAEIRLSVYDALGQNRAVWQSASDTYTQITRSQVLSQYFMLTFTYTFGSRKTAAASTSDRPRGGGMMPPPR